MILSEVGNGSVLLWMFEFFMFVIWFWLLITVFGDLFSDRDMSGFTKVIWCIFVIVAPFLGCFIYFVVRGGGMAQRSMDRVSYAQAQYNAQIEKAAAGLSPADQIASAKSLLDAGTIDQGEFDRLKAKALG